MVLTRTPLESSSGNEGSSYPMNDNSGSSGMAVIIILRMITVVLVMTVVTITKYDHSYDQQFLMTFALL
jgi:hypothetical protein